MKMKIKSKIKFIRLAPAVLLSAVALLSAFMVTRDLSIQQKEKDEFKSLSEITVIGNDEFPPLPSADTVSKSKEKSKSKKDEQTNHTAEDTYVSAPVYEYRYHSVQELISMNADCFGWISIPGTNVNYPVMHTPNDPQKYLNTSFYGEYSFSGTPFLDSRCSFDSTNLIIYGHHMNNGTMFADICSYRDYSYFTQHPTVVLETKDGTFAYSVFSVMTVRSNDLWYGFTDSPTESAYNSRINYAKAHSVYDTGITPSFGMQILTLSTCCGSTGDSRILVLAVRN